MVRIQFSDMLGKGGVIILIAMLQGACASVQSTVTEQASGNDQALNAYKQVKTVGTQEAYISFLKDYPDGEYATRASRDLEQIRESELKTYIEKGRVSEVGKLVQNGTNLESVGKYGNSPLHLAFLNKQIEIAELLVKSGADNRIENDFGLVPSQMWQLAETKATVTEAAGLLNNEAQWHKVYKARELYEELQEMDPNLVVTAILLKVLEDTELRLRTLFLAIKLGIPGSEEKLNRALMEHGDKSMAEDFLNSGSRKLANGGQAWASEHGYRIMTGMGSHRSYWGRF